jgi:hypothetical protein
VHDITRVVDIQNDRRRLVRVGRQIGAQAIQIVRVFIAAGEIRFATLTCRLPG